MTYGNSISLVRNTRGIYCLDTTMGCSSGMANTDGGCYGDCYAAKSAKLYGYDFTKTVLREFKGQKHKRDIQLAVSRIKMPFVRIGCSGDPSENWEHTINVLKVIAGCNKEIVIITRHWELLTDEQLQYLSTINVCVNTSVSALDKPNEIERSLDQYNRLKPFCKSILRVISCDFNKEHPVGFSKSIIQDALFKNDHVIDTVFRPSKLNRFVTDGIVNVKTEVFNGHKALASKYNRKTYMGKCNKCLEMCGAAMVKDHNYPKPFVKQSQIWEQY
jgi:hypothetical protein